MVDADVDGSNIFVTDRKYGSIKEYDIWDSWQEIDLLPEYSGKELTLHLTSIGRTQNFKCSNVYIGRLNDISLMAARISIPGVIEGVIALIAAVLLFAYGIILKHYCVTEYRDSIFDLALMSFCVFIWIASNSPMMSIIFAHGSFRLLISVFTLFLSVIPCLRFYSNVLPTKQKHLRITLIIYSGLILALILALMSSSPPADAAVLARDTVFAAVMLICNGIIGICLLIGGVKNYVQRYSLHGSKAAINVLLAIALIVFILPNFTTSMTGGGMINSQLIFVASCCLILYAAFIFTQTIRHRDYFIADGTDDEHHRDNAITTAISVGFLLVSLVTVVGLAKMLSPAIEAGLMSVGLPKIVLGIIIAALVLLPESIAAVKAAYNDQLQNSLNLGLGSALASISLTIPVIALMAVTTATPVVFGLSAKESVMLVITLLITMNTLSTGHTTFLHGVIHLVMLATFIFFSIVP